MSFLGDIAQNVFQAMSGPTQVPPIPATPAKKRRSSGARRLIPATETRWLRSDIEAARRQADAGDMSRAARLADSLRTDGVADGLLSTRTGGLVRLPRLFAGTPAAVAWLRGADGESGVFDKIFPSVELELLARDGLVLGIGVGEFVQECWARLPHLVRLPPEFLRYRRFEDRWYYQSERGLEPIVPGNGRWVLVRGGGEIDPHKAGLIWALGKAYVDREHAELMRANYAAKLANPARVAVSPQGSSEEQSQSWFRKVMAWGVNTTFGMKPGYDVKLIESNGRGIEVFKDELDHGERIYMIQIAGQIVTVTGGAGFANAGIHASIRSDLVQATGQWLARDISEQGLTPIIEEFLSANDNARVEWDTRPPADLKAGAEALTATAAAMAALREELAQHKNKAGQPLGIDVRSIAARYNVPIAGDVDGDGEPDEGAPDGPALATANDAPSEDYAAQLAAKMTEHGVARCEHGSSNRCRICGIERVRDFVPGVDGAEHTWSVAWRPIAHAATERRRAHILAAIANLIAGDGRTAAESARNAAA